MIKSRVVLWLLCLGLLLAVLGGLVGGGIALATQESSHSPFSLSPNQEFDVDEKLELSSKFPVLSGVSGHSFEFQVELTYVGNEDRTFDLVLDAPPQWTVDVTERFGGTENIAALHLKRFENVPTGLKLQFAPTAGYEPEPGEYPLTLMVASAMLQTSIELKAIVTARYAYAMFPATGRLNTEMKAGEEHLLSILIINDGSAAIENMTFSSGKPEGWEITYIPDEIGSLGAGLTQEVNVAITPPDKTIAGDYRVTLRGSAEQGLSDTIELRVTVLTSTIWGWVGILIVVVVVAGLAVLFWRLGRR
jgi:uncharacterized membrane protein